MDEKVTLNMKEQKRLQVLNQVLAGQITAPEAAQSLGLSLRQVRRLIAAYRQKGAAGLAHGNRGRPSPRRIPDPVRQEILRLAKTIYQDYNDVHLTEKLADEHGLHLSRATVRALRRTAGLPSPRKRRPPRHRSRRPRRPQAGMLLQVDGSPHDWLEGRGPALTLIAAIDDATNEVPAALSPQAEGRNDDLALFLPAQPGPPMVGHFTPTPTEGQIPAPPLTPEAPLQSQKPPRKPHQPLADHPWRRAAIAAKPRDNHG